MEQQRVGQTGINFYWTLICSSALNNLVSTEDGNITCMHQCPVRKKPKTSGNTETVDTGFIKMQNGHPCQTVGVGDGKNHHFAEAVNETSVYAHCAMNLCEGSALCPVIIGMPYTHDMRLHFMCLYWSVNPYGELK